jgi:hypothetical protein
MDLSAGVSRKLSPDLRRRCDPTDPRRREVIMGTRLSARICAVAARLLAIAVLVTMPNVSQADEGGLSFWLPGLFGSLAAVPGQPGWAASALYYHTSVSATAEKDFALAGHIVTGVKGSANLSFFGPTYVFATPVLGGQAALSLLGVGGGANTSIATTLTGPRGNTLSGGLSEPTAGAFGDLIPQGSLKWNHGVHNFMTYLTGDVPVGQYDATNLANLGIGHGALDGGAGYTYFNPLTGHELSAVSGLTYNFTNQALEYQNGIDFHLDWGASQFLSKQLFVGLVGYFFNQVTGDSGPGARLGAFQSRVAGIGPQIGYVVPLGAMQGFVGLKGYGEFAAQNRASGWNLWLTFSISPAAPTSPATSPRFR